jgi:hypothetical protein
LAPPTTKERRLIGSIEGEERTGATRKKQDNRRQRHGEADPRVDEPLELLALTVRRLFWTKRFGNCAARRGSYAEIGGDEGAMQPEV